jgi:hypothetical protein
VITDAPGFIDYVDATDGLGIEEAISRAMLLFHHVNARRPSEVYLHPDLHAQWVALIGEEQSEPGDDELPPDAGVASGAVFFVRKGTLSPDLPRRIWLVARLDRERAQNVGFPEPGDRA